MSRRVTELVAETLSVSACATRAWRLRERADTASIPARARMLRAMSDAYMAFGLAISHYEHGSSPEKVADLVEAGKMRLGSARVAARAAGGE